MLIQILLHSMWFDLCKSKFKILYDLSGSFLSNSIKSLSNTIYYCDVASFIEKQSLSVISLPSEYMILLVFVFNLLKSQKDQDICLLELTEDVIESGRHNNVLLRTICLPDNEPIHGSKCFTSGIHQAGFRIDALTSERPLEPETKLAVFNLKTILRIPK